MKKLVTSAVIVGAMLAAGSSAASMAEVKPYAGVDYYQVWMEGKGSVTLNNTAVNGKDAFRKSYPGASVYAGIKFMEYVGAELGADWSKTKTQTTASGANSVSNKVKRNGGHLDLVGFWPVLCGKVDLIGSLGAGLLKPKFDSSVNGVGVTTTSKSKTVARIGVGANYLFTEMLGARVLVRWEGTSHLKANFSNTGEVKPFKNTTSLTLGAFAQF